MENSKRHKEENSRTQINNTQAVRDKTIVILQEQEYNEIINDFIQTNQFTDITQNLLNL
jgi:hypothetical protein